MGDRQAGLWLAHVDFADLDHAKDLQARENIRFKREHQV
jgi:hypothetical protein